MYLLSLLRPSACTVVRRTVAPLLLMSIFSIGFAPAASADVPVSVGTYGSIERATLTQGTSRKGSAATFGTPGFEESRGFSFRLRIPILAYGNEANEAVNGARNIIPYLNAPGVRRVNTGSAMMDGPLDFLAAEDLSDIASFIPAIEIGEERKPFHLQAGALSSRLGHGTQVHYFTNSPEGAARRMGVFLELNSSSLGAQVMMADVMNPLAFVAGRVYGRPIQWFVAPDSLLQPNDLDIDPRGEIAGIWVTGVSGAFDGGVEGFTLNGLDPVWYVGWDNELAVLDNKFIKAIGMLDLNVLGRSRPGLDSKALPFDIGQRIRLPFGAGAHPGMRFSLDIPVALQLGLEGEYNFASEGYVPRYFDRLYFIERSRMFGTNLAKRLADAPASHGYRLKANATVLKTVSLFLETQDQFPFQSSRGTNSGLMTAGASVFVMMVGASATVSQAGIRNYTSPGFFGPGFIFTAEARMTLIANIFHIVARYYRVHDPVDVNLIDRDYDTVEGAILGLEINFDLNTPIPLW